MGQQYGFMDLVLSKDRIHIDMYSAVSQRFRRRVTVAPVERKHPRGSRRLPDLFSALAPEQSCARYGCMTTNESTYPCQCNPACLAKRNCCTDYKDVCQSALRRPSGSEDRRLRGQKSDGHELLEMNLTQAERCNAVRRRTSNTVQRDVVVTVIPDSAPASDVLPGKSKEMVFDLSAEECFAKCGNRSGYCEYFCGVGKACCSQGSMNDKRECQSASTFTARGKYECVGVQDPTGDLWMKRMNVRMESFETDIRAQGQSRLGHEQASLQAFGTSGRTHKSALPWWRVALAMGSISLASGVGLVVASRMRCFDRSRRSTRNAQLQAISASQGSDDEPAE